MELIRYNSIRKWADVVYDFPSEYYRGEGVNLAMDLNLGITPNAFPFNTKIFIKTDLLPHAIELLHSINYGFHLMTGGSDLSPTDNIELRNIVLSIPNLMSWVGTNLESVEPRMLTIPIGFQESERSGSINLYRYIYENRSIRKDKEINILIPFLGESHTSRKLLIEMFGRKLSETCFSQSTRLSHQRYMNQISKSRYVVCPRGNGIDTHRIYEAVLAGAIPLIESTSIWAMHRQFGLIIENWDELITVPEWPLMEVPPHEFLSESYWRDKVAIHQMQFMRIRN